MEQLTTQFQTLGKRKRSIAFCAMYTNIPSRCTTCEQSLLNKGGFCFGCFYDRMDGLGKYSFHNRLPIQRVKHKK